MPGTTVTLRPNSTQQLGSWTVVGAANAHTALSDNTDTTYVQLVPRCRTNDQVLRVGFPAPTPPAGAQIFSVAVRRRVQTVVPPAPQPQCSHWFRCNSPSLVGLVTTLVVDLLRFFFWSRCPQQPTSVWIEETLPAQLTDPNGNPWTVAGSFSPFYYDLGRDDTNANPLRISEVYIDVTYIQQSTITVTAPTGTITATCRPTATWTYASPDSLPQAASQVAVYTAAQVAAGGFQAFVTPPLQQSGWVLGESLQWTLAADLVNGSYYAYVQVSQQWTGPGSFVSGVASTNWTQSISGAPVAVLQTAAFDATYNRVQLVMLPSSSSPTTYAYAVQVSRDLGATWGPVRGGLLIAATGMTPLTLYDHEAPLNQASQYRVLSYGQTGSLLFPASAFSSTLSVTPFSEGHWLKDPLNPLLNSPLPVLYLGDTVVQKKVQGTFEPLSGGAFAQKIVVNGPMYGIEGTLNLIFHHKQAGDLFAAFQALESSRHILLLQSPTGEQHYIALGPGASGSDKTWMWDIIPGTNQVKYRKLTVSYTETAAPPITT